MNILLTIHHNLDPNAGAPGITWQLGQEYQRLGHKVYYYSFSNLSSRLPEILKALVFPALFANHLSALTGENAIDIIDASTGDAWIWAKLSQSMKNRPLLMTRSHGLEHIMHLETLAEANQGNLQLSWKYPFYHGGLRLWEVANSLRDADAALFSNRLDLDYAVKHLGVRPEQAHTFVNGIPKAFIGLPYEPTPLDETTAIRIAQVGSYIPRKGIHYGVPALDQILVRHPHVSMSFFGTGCSEAQVYADFEPGLHDRIHVIPRYAHETLPDLLRGHQIKLFPTLSEGFSLALPEAMACGLAPVTTLIPGSLEIIQDGHNGILIPTRDSLAIEQALERLISDRSYLDRLRQNAYATAQRYSWNRIAETTLTLYEQSLSAMTS